MNYKGNICIGCGELFDEYDDIVVCPECGTPQHRKCYEKENRCVNSDMHSEDYRWKGITPSATETTEREETIPCPNCGFENKKGSEICRNCGMKFTIFGMNVVDAIDAENKKNLNPNADIPDYKPPFTLGEGEGFDYERMHTAESTPEQVGGILSDILSGNQSTTTDGRLNLGGPFPDSDEIYGVKTNNIGNFVGSNGLSYISKFKKMEAGKVLSFNFAAFFFAPYWFFYRKLYKPGILFITAFLALGILAIPSSLELMEYMNQLAATLPATIESITEAQLMELYNEMLTHMTPMLIFTFAGIMLRLVCGFIANPIYRKYVIENAGTAERMDNKPAAMAYMVKHGGASILIALASFFANEIISVLVSYLL